MEQEGNSEHLMRELYFLTPEQIAVRALVDEMIARQDARVFKLLNEVIEDLHKENGAT